MSSRWFKTRLAKAVRSSRRAAKRHMKRHGHVHEAYCGVISSGVGGNEGSSEPEYVEYCTCQYDAPGRLLWYHPRRKKRPDRKTMDGYVQPCSSDT